MIPTQVTLDIMYWNELIFYILGMNKLFNSFRILISFFYLFQIFENVKISLF